MYADGLPVGGNPLNIHFAGHTGTQPTRSGKEIVRAYTNLLTGEGMWRQDKGNGLNFEHFIGGSALFAFQLEPNFSHHGEYMSLVKNGNVRLEVHFRSGLTGT